LFVKRVMAGAVVGVTISDRFEWQPVALGVCGEYFWKWYMCVVVC
jgi:hypothetical protein